MAFVYVVQEQTEQLQEINSTSQVLVHYLHLFIPLLNHNLFHYQFICLMGVFDENKNMT